MTTMQYKTVFIDVRSPWKYDCGDSAGRVSAELEKAAEGGWALVSTELVVHTEKKGRKLMAIFGRGRKRDAPMG